MSIENQPTIINKQDHEFAFWKHNYQLDFSIGGSYIVNAESLDSALEEFGQWARKNAPGYVAEHPGQDASPEDVAEFQESVDNSDYLAVNGGEFYLNERPANVVETYAEPGYKSKIVHIANVWTDEDDGGVRQMALLASREDIENLKNVVHSVHHMKLLNLPFEVDAIRFKSESNVKFFTVYDDELDQKYGYDRSENTFSAEQVNEDMPGLYAALAGIDPQVDDDKIGIVSDTGNSLEVDKNKKISFYSRTTDDISYELQSDFVDIYELEQSFESLMQPKSKIAPSMRV